MRQPEPGYVDVRRAALEGAPDVLAALDEDAVTLDTATSALLARCVETPEELELEDYRRTDPGFPRAACDRHPELLDDLRAAARIAATPGLCEEMVETLSAA